MGLGSSVGKVPGRKQWKEESGDRSQLGEPALVLVEVEGSFLDFGARGSFPRLAARQTSQPERLCHQDTFTRLTFDGCLLCS